MANRQLGSADLWWARELFRIERLVDTGIDMLHDEAIDELHSCAAAIHRKLSDEYRRRMGVIVE